MAVLKYFILILLLLSSLLAFSQTKSAKLHSIKQGDTLYSILKQFDFNREQVNLAIRKRILPKKYVLVPKNKYLVIKDDPRLEIRFYHPDDNLTYSFWRNTTSAGNQILKNHFQVKLKEVSGKLQGSIVFSIRKKTKSSQVAYRFLDAFVFDYKVPRALKKGAFYSLKYQELYDHGHFIKTGEVLSAQLEINDEIISRRFLPTIDGGTFVDIHSKQKLRPLYAPVNYLRVTSLYQPRRFHPITKRRQPHLGIDFQLPEGEKIYASSSGVLIKKGRRRGAGNYLAIRHQNGLETYYNHLSKFAQSLKVGQTIQAGQHIGYIGCTGYCTKPHLHFAVKKKNRYIDPIKVLKGYSYHHKKKVNYSKN